MVGTELKVAIIAVAVTCYLRPQLLLQSIMGETLDGADIDAFVRVFRGLLTLLSYSLASMRFSWFWVLVVVATLHLTMWGLQLGEDSVFGMSREVEMTMFHFGGVLCFGIVMGISLFGGKHDTKTRFRKRLIAFYKKHNPSKLHDVDDLVEKYELNEELLFQRLHRKYNALAAGPDNHSVMKKIDESEFLYEEAEEEREESDEEKDKLEATPLPTDDEEEELAETMHYMSTSHGAGNGRYDEKFNVVKKKNWSTTTVTARRLEITSYDELDGTPPASPRTAETLAFTHRQSSTLIKDAIEIARRAQRERIECRIATIASKSGDGYAGH
ncbi:uncharacterized protein PHALS_11703 [Plasmopara halstedii]|uniref:Transmembrane protein n=1 Tax=Plasmopara halstedii TaxID=4781 RepID=A0A0P1AKJ2_PLAHL|nr:uncharacterized protein PHALS_11703 [Plasmopara halstedii]CEG41352.1 hypothetical protein PHALS_11703 [Plasmopara halstedii]|eukprot:XP_024577721.1 hypothetical protein PHALS_11703 [Plasmopara halstedii]